MKITKEQVKKIEALLFDSKYDIKTVWKVLKILGLVL